MKNFVSYGLQKGQLDIVSLINFCINLNVQHVNGMTHFDLQVLVWLLGTLE